MIFTAMKEANTLYFQAIPTKIEFTFLTECLSADFRKKIETHLPKETPDIIVMNSCLWDITRYDYDLFFRVL